MIRQIYGRREIAAIKFPEEIEIRIRPYSRKDNTPATFYFPKAELETWDFVKWQCHFNSAEAERYELLLKEGNSISLSFGDYLVDIPAEIDMEEFE